MLSMQEKEKIGIIDMIRCRSAESGWRCVLSGDMTLQSIRGIDDIHIPNIDQDKHNEDGFTAIFGESVECFIDRNEYSKRLVCISE